MLKNEETFWKQRKHDEIQNKMLREPMKEIAGMYVISPEYSLKSCFSL